MKNLLPLLLISVLSGCASAPLTEEEKEEKEYIEQDRKNRYIAWEEDCSARGGVIFSYKPSRTCRRRGCVPDRFDWRWDEKRERPSVGNRIQCLSKSQANRVLRDLMR